MCRQLELPDLLIKPMQRLCKYPLLLRVFIILNFIQGNIILNYQFRN